MTEFRFYERRKWIEVLEDMERDSKAKSATKMIEVICKGCILDPICSEMCQKFIRETIDNEKRWKDEEKIKRDYNCILRGN